MFNAKKSTNLMVKIALLSTIAFIFMFFEFPILPAFPFLKIDFSDLPALIGAFAYGPIAGIAIEGLKNILVVLLKGTMTGGIGEFANFLIGISFIIPAGIIYRRNKNIKTTILSVIIASIIMSIVGIVLNKYILVPLYVNFLPALNDPAYVREYLLFGVLPFNLIKGVAVSVLTILFYKRAESFILKEIIATTPKQKI